VVGNPVGLPNTIIAAIMPFIYFVIGFGVFFIMFYYKGLDPHERKDFKNILDRINPIRKPKAEAISEEPPGEEK
jgi:hypothetical protein